MASSVTAPLERQFGQIPSLAQMTSVSSATSSQITLQFTLDRNIDPAQQDVQAAINAASSVLPANLPAPPTYSKSNPADVPILTLAITSETLPLARVNDYADSILAQKISQVSGVGLVTLGGAQRPAVRIQVDPEALAGTGLTLEDVRLGLVAANINAPKGTLDTPRQEYTLATDDQLSDAKSFAPVVLAYKNGSPLRLRGRGDAHRRGGERAARRLGRRPAGDHPQRPAPARGERDRGRRPGEGAAAPARGQPPPGHPRVDPQRPHRDGAGQRGGRGVHAGAHHRAGGGGDLRLPPQPPGHHHPRHHRAL